MGAEAKGLIEVRNEQQRRAWADGASFRAAALGAPGSALGCERWRLGDFRLGGEVHRWMSTPCSRPSSRRPASARRGRWPPAKASTRVGRVPARLRRERRPAQARFPLPRGDEAQEHEPLRPLRILQVATFDRAGGAEQVAMNLHQGFRGAGRGGLARGGLPAGRTSPACSSSTTTPAEERASASSSGRRRWGGRCTGPRRASSAA